MDGLTVSSVQKCLRNAADEADGLVRKCQQV